MQCILIILQGGRGLPYSKVQNIFSLIEGSVPQHLNFYHNNVANHMLLTGGARQAAPELKNGTLNPHPRRQFGVPEDSSLEPLWGTSVCA